MDYYPAPGRNHLFVPGPTNVPEPILRAMNRSNEDHRSPAFPKLSKSVIEDVKQIFGTTAATSFIFPTTGLVASFPACPFANCLSERGDQQAKAFVHQSVCRFMEEEAIQSLYFFSQLNLDRKSWIFLSVH
jgi:hypothetical protein